MGLSSNLRMFERVVGSTESVTTPARDPMPIARPADLLKYELRTLHVRVDKF